MTPAERAAKKAERATIKENNKKLPAEQKAARAARKAERVAAKLWDTKPKAEEETARVKKAIADKTAEWDEKDKQRADRAEKNQKNWDFQLKAGRMEQKEYDKRMAEAAKKKDDSAKERERAIAKAKAPASPAPGLANISTDEKKQVKAAFQKAATKMRETQNLPGRKDTYTVGDGEWTTLFST